MATFDISTTFAADDPVFTDAGASDPSTDDPPHLSRGGKYKLFGTAKDDVDPENPYNEVISFDTTDPTTIAGAYRKFGDHVKVGQLDNQVELKYYFVAPKNAVGGLRIQLGISGDGDGKFDQYAGGPDQNAFGYLGNMAFGCNGTCATNTWVYEDMTNMAPKWDLSQFNPPPLCTTCSAGPACNMTCTWAQMVTYISARFPNHRVLNAVLVDDGSYIVADQGCAYYDLLSTGARTLTGHEDTGGSGKDPNGC